MSEEKRKHLKKCFVEHTRDRYGNETAIIREVKVAEQVTELQGEHLSRFADAKNEVLESKYDELCDINSRREELIEEIEALTRVESFDQYVQLKDVCDVIGHSQYDDGGDQ